MKQINSTLLSELMNHIKIPTAIYQNKDIVYKNNAFSEFLKLIRCDEDCFFTTYLSTSDLQNIHIQIKEKSVYIEIVKSEIISGLILYQFIDQTEEQIHLKNLENTIISLQEIDKKRNLFLENLSHELRTPLTGIIGFTDLLKYTNPNEEALMYIDSLSESANRMVDTLNNINDFTLITSDTILIHHEEVDLHSLLRHLCDAYYYKAKSKGLKIHFSGEVMPAVKFYSDGKKIEKIVQQLLSNAIKFTDRGKIEVSYAMDSHECMISVSDTGIGIAPDKIDECFEDFKQLSEGYSRHYEGSGLGLSIVKKMTQLLQGRIEVKSEVSKGSTFTVYIPNASKQISVRNESEKAIAKKGKNILYVEDNYLNQRLLEISLSGKYNITLADSAEQGIDLLGKQDFNLVLMDINLGKGMNGVEAMKKIKENKNFHGIPVIAITAYALANDEDKFLKEGFDDYIPKPYTKDEIITKISKFIYQ